MHFNIIFLISKAVNNPKKTAASPKKTTLQRNVLVRNEKLNFNRNWTILK